METHPDKYLNNLDFEDTALPQTVGFVSFFREDIAAYFFRFNDKKGQPFLYSQGYQKASKRDQYVRLLIEDEQLKKFAKIIQEATQWLIVIYTKNEQEIARSKFYQDQPSAQKAYKYLFKKLKKIVFKRNLADPKFAFRIDLYPREEEAVAGVITNVLNGENEKFLGVELPTVNHFMKKQVVKDREAT